MKDSVIAAVAIFILLSFAAVATFSNPAALRPEAGVNRGVVELKTGGSAGILVRIAEDLATVVNDGATRRVLAVMGIGSLQNITDLKLLHGIDLATLLELTRFGGHLST